MICMKKKSPSIMYIVLYVKYVQCLFFSNKYFFPEVLRREDVVKKRDKLISYYLSFKENMSTLRVHCYMLFFYH